MRLIAKISIHAGEPIHFHKEVRARASPDSLRREQQVEQYRIIGDSLDTHVIPSGVQREDQVVIIAVVVHDLHREFVNLEALMNKRLKAVNERVLKHAPGVRFVCWTD